MLKIGIIAEDISDIETLTVLIRRINDIPFKIRKQSTKGCGRLKQKCRKYAENMLNENATHIIICHDLDGNNKKKYNCLRKELKSKVSHIHGYEEMVCIVIPIVPKNI